MSELPAGWTTVAIGEICSQGEQRIPATDEKFAYIDIASVDRVRKAVLKPQIMLGLDAPSRARKVVASGDIIVSMTRPNLNAVAMIDDHLDAAIASTGFDVLRSEGVDSRWIFAAVRSADFVNEMTAKVQGALYPAIKSGDIRNYKIPLPPFEEQKRIAQKLDSLLAQVDTLKTRIDAIPAALNRFRESAIESATTGVLTETWRQNQGTDAHWIYRPLGELASPMEQGWSPKCDPVAVPPGGSTWAVIKTTAIQPARFNPNENKRLPENLEPRPHLCIEIGDIIITRAGPRSRAAVCCYVDSSPINLMLCDKAYRFRAIDEVYEGELLALILNSPTYKEKLDSLKTGISESGVNLTMSKLQALVLPQPPLAEQKEILRRLKALLTFADQLEARVLAAQKRIDTLTQSLLAKAFRGELVPQDPNDEPASVLLERIRAQRAAAPKPKRGRKATVN